MAGARHRLGALIAAIVAAAPAIVSAGVSLPAYFSPPMPPFRGGQGCPSLPAPAPGIPVHWFQQTQPPVTGDTCRTFALSPLTDASDQLVSRFSTSNWTGGLWPRVWAFRGPRPSSLHLPNPGSNPIYPYINTPSCKDPKGPPQGDMILGLDYSTIGKANAATTAEILRMLGAPTSTWQAPLVAAGFNMATALVNFSAVAADPAKYVNYNAGCNSYDKASFVLKDRFIVHDDPRWVYVNGQSTPPTGVMIDYEVNDFRTVSQGAVFLVNLANQIHARSIGGVRPKVFLYTNPWIYVDVHRGLIGGMAANGFGYLHMDAVKSAFDYLSLYLLNDKFTCNIDEAYSVEMLNLAGVSGIVEPGKLVVTVDFTRCTTTDALALFNLNATQHFAGYAVFPKTQLMGGQQLPLAHGNLLLWKLLYGAKAPP